ncbi:MAG: hypothetical protein L3J08_04040 [Flavobacteriaceae bacterium]|nr:hypothetical protein [Flavobacteriaceae bacterium]
MALSKEHITQLYKFTQQHYIEYYDVQTEMVDHLANDIEQIWEEQPQLSFQKARELSFKKFGIFGFMDVLGEKENVLNKKYWKMVWKIFIKFFKIPQIILTLSIAIGWYQLFKIFPQKETFQVIGIGCFIIILFRLVILAKQKEKRFQKTNKKWLLEDNIYNIGNMYLLLNLFFQINFHISKVNSNTEILVLSFVFTVIIILFYITTFILPSKAEEILEKEYPEYKFVINS